MLTFIPYYADNGITIYHGDCIEVMKTFQDRSFDMVLADLPYGLTAPKWDSIIPMSSLWEAYSRIIKPDGVLAFTSCQPFTTMLISSNIARFKYCWYWIKNQGTNFFHAKRMPIRKVEEIVIFGGNKYYPQISDGHVPTNSAKGCTNGNAYHGTSKRDYVGGKTTRYPTNVLTFNCVDNYSRLHSSEKPLTLFEYLIKTYTKENEIILDNTMGSGTTLVAAKSLGRQAVGIDIEKKWCYVTKERLNFLKESENVRSKKSTK